MKTATRMADRRQLIYDDEDASAVRNATDQRDFPEVTVASELRYDALVDDWVVVASHRQSRTFLPPTSECPLCPSRSHHVTEIPSPDYDVVVFENRFPSLAKSVAAITDTVHPDEPLFARRTEVVGRCEVVCFTSDHDVAFSALEAPIDRSRALAFRRLGLISIQCTPDKLKYLAGSESGIGAWIENIRLAHRAEQLRALDV